MSPISGHDQNVIAVNCATYLLLRNFELESINHLSIGVNIAVDACEILLQKLHSMHSAALRAVFSFV